MNLKRFIAILTFAGLYLGAGAASAAEDTVDHTRVYTLGEFVVSTTRIPGEKVATHLEITSSDMERRNAQTLDQALKLLPGVEISKGSKGVPRVNIRGFRSRHTILLLNGIPVNSTYDGQFDPSLIPTTNIARIKVSYGAHSVLYGQGGLAGVINIITKQGTSGLHMNVSAQMDERGNHYSRAGVSGGSGPVDYFVSFTQKDNDGFALPDDFDATKNEDGGIRENSDNRSATFFGNLGFRASEAVTLGVTLEKTSGTFGAPPSIPDDKNDLFYKSPKYDRTEDYDVLSGQVSMGYDPGGMFGFRTWAFMNTQDDETARFDDDTYTTMTKKGSYHINSETSVKGATFQPRFDLGSPGEITASVSAQTDAYTASGEQVLKKNKPATAFTMDHELDLFSAALEYRTRLMDRLDLVAGVGQHWQERETDADDDATSYMVGASYDVTGTTALRTSYAHKIRFPSIRQLYDPEAGNSDLTVESSDNYEIGIRFTGMKDTVFDLAFFQNNVSDYIEKIDSTDRFENNDEYEFKGFDLSVGHTFGDAGSVWLGYTYMETEDESPGSPKDELQNRPQHKLSLAADYTWYFGLTAHAELLHVADQYFYSKNFDKGKVGDYTIVNVKFEQVIIPDTAWVFVGFDNLFDSYYEESYGYPQAGRTGYAGIKASF